MPVYVHSHSNRAFRTVPRSQRATFGAFLEFSRDQGDSENSRAEPTVILYDRRYKRRGRSMRRFAARTKLHGCQVASIDALSPGVIRARPCTGPSPGRTTVKPQL